MALLDVTGLSTSFFVRKSGIHAVRNVSFSVKDRETVGLVGESGSGKSVLCLSLLKLLPQPPAKTSGSALFNGTDLINCKEGEIRSIRGNKIAMIFQDPLTSLNPYLKIADQMIEPLMVHRAMKKKAALGEAIAMLSRTGIADAASKIHSYPHEFSGGMCQRVMIAMALLTSPQLLIADEPTTALDVTVQVQILQLLRDIQKEFGMSVIFITHDLNVASRLCDRIMVMYAGQILESGTRDDLFKNTAHPYTKALLSSVPALQQPGTRLSGINGRPPDLAEALHGCPFVKRCTFAGSACEHEACEPGMISEGHSSSCIRVRRQEIRL